MTHTPDLHIYFVLDRSGSMASMADDVIGGFNTFLKDQKADGRDAAMTLIQFDSMDAHEVLAEGALLESVSPLTAQTFQPRGGTPLYDAMGHAIADATIRVEQRHAWGKPAEELLFVTFTDGHENQSREYDREKIFQLVSKREEAGWTFVYLGANQDSYAAGGDVGFRAGNIQNFAGDGQGSRAAFASLSSSTSRRRAKIRSGQQYDKSDLFEGHKEAERQLKGRRGAETRS
jgi:uncharacterized protein YegL